MFFNTFSYVSQENADRELQEQRRAERQRENLEKRRSLAVCSGSELDDLERTLERNLSYTWSRRSLRRQPQRFHSFQDKSLEPSSLQSKDLQQPLKSEDNSKNSQLMRHSLKECVKTVNGLNRIEMDSILLEECVLQSVVDGNMAATPDTTATIQQEREMNTSPVMGLNFKKVMKVETQVHKTSEMVTQVKTDTVLETDCIKASTQESDGVDIQANAKISQGSGHLEILPQLAQEAGPISPERERQYPRVGETLECHTLVKGLHSYEALSPTGQRVAQSHCSKWKKEMEAEERDGASLPQSKDAPKTLNKSPSKRGLASQFGPCNSSGIPRARSKPEPSLSEGSATPRGSRLTSTRSVSMRSPVVTRPRSIQVELKRSISTRDKAIAHSDRMVKQNCQPPEKPSPEHKTLPRSHQQLVRGSPLRVSKWFVPHTESQSPCQAHTIQSPTAASNTKAVRTAVINAAKAKSAKNADTASSKATAGSRTAGPKIPRPATQPMWR